MHVTRYNTKHLPHINKKYFTELKRKIINFMFMRLNKWIAMFWKYLILCCAYSVIYLMNKKSNYFPLQYIISMTFTKIKYCYMLSIMLVLFYIFFSSFFSAKFNFLITIHHLHFFLEIFEMTIQYLLYKYLKKYKQYQLCNGLIFCLI